MRSFSSSPKIAIEPVPSDICLSDGRFYITVRQFDLRWRYPIQFHWDEIQALLPHLLTLNWNLDPNNGYPIEVSGIHAQIERLLDENQGQAGRIAA